MAILKNKREEVLNKMKNSVSMYENREWSESQSYYNNGLCLSFHIGPIDRGPRIDHGGGEDGDDWLDDNEVEELAERHYEENISKINSLEGILKSEFEDYKCELKKTTVDYGEKGHVSVELEIVIEGRFFNWKEDKLWADYSGKYEKNKITLFTPDIERYFDSEEEIVNFLNTFNYKSEDPF